MSNRTIVEFNHDSAWMIDAERFEFCNRLVVALKTNGAEEWSAL